jgi:UDP-N-acetylmuramyl pentapeptide phosphotransferase/UDP-N-acetylglucosamine-1-phosphate transferase
MLVFLLAFAAGAFLTLLIVRSSHMHGPWSADSDITSPQKVHKRPVPRIGGVGVVGALLVALPLVWLIGPVEGAWVLGLLLLCGAPAFGVGLLEDFTKRVAPSRRLLLTAAAALAAVWLLDTPIRRTDLWGFDWLASFYAGSVFLAVFTVTGIANAVNIIDGFNGLASMCVVIMLLALTYVAMQVGDPVVAVLALAGAGAVMGFFIWNYPAGLVFLGDGGAYFLGFYVAQLSLLLLNRNPEVSPLFPLLMLIYPVFETLFSIYRRRVIMRRAVGMPDGVHLHSLVYRRLLRWAVGPEDASRLGRRTVLTAPYLWLLCMLAVIPSVLFWNDSRVLGVCIVLFAASYLYLYRRLVRFQTPRWLRGRVSGAASERLPRAARDVPADRGARRGG